MAAAVAPGHLDQRLDLVGGEVLPGPKLGVFLPLGTNCSIYFGWRHHAQVRFCHMKPMSLLVDCS
jgi:hypothetical protein